MAAPLEGVTVIDLTRFIPGPFCTVMLGDMGADVIKVEDPAARSAPKGIIDQREGRRLAYSALERNKRSIALNLKDAAGREAFYRLVRVADVVVDDFRPGVTARLDIDYPTLKETNPRIVCCSVSSYGQDGPYRDVPGFDPNYLAISGVLGITGGPDGSHVIPAVPVADYAAGMNAVIGVLLALRVRQETGRGQFVDVSCADTMVYWMGTRHWPLFLSDGMKPVRGRRPSHVYRTKDDRYICFSFGTVVFWERLCRALGLERYVPYYEDIQTLGMDAYMPDPEGVRRRQKEAVGAVQTVLGTRTLEEWMPVLKEADTCFSPVYELEEVMEDPQVRSRGMVVEVEHPETGVVRQVGVPLRLSETPGGFRRFAPRRGEHTREVLGSLGYSAVEMAEMAARGVIA
ncbi:MAG: CoA transferase [Chloroflexi bacterium]|nr:CoA transferase [Chloroflexota bacterium]